MNLKDIEDLAEELVKKYNPTVIVPFPFKKILEDKSDLRIFESEKLGEDVSGAISYLTDKKIYVILINAHKTVSRKYFTTAHEIGHYFLHKELISKSEILVDNDPNVDNLSVLYLSDNPLNPSQTETEANRFAASLLMPKEWVIKAWNELKDVEDCAKVFNVSVSSMSIRLEKMKLL